MSCILRPQRARSSQQPFTFASAYLDSEIGLYKMGARSYDPAIGRFTQPDPLGMNVWDPATWDLYAYAGNNPVNWWDPTGLCWEQVGMSAVSIGLGALPFGKSIGSKVAKHFGGQSLTAVGWAAINPDDRLAVSLQTFATTTSKLAWIPKYGTAASMVGQMPNFGYTAARCIQDKVF